MALFQDLRQGLRMLVKNPGFTVVAAITLALGIGANTAMFSVVNEVLLRPLAYLDPNRLVTISAVVPKLSHQYPVLRISAYHLAEWRRQSRTLGRVACLAPGFMNLTGAGEPERLNAERLSAGLFPMLGVHPEIGCNFESLEATLGNRRVTVESC